MIDHLLSDISGSIILLDRRALRIKTAVSGRVISIYDVLIGQQSLVENVSADRQCSGFLRGRKATSR